DFNSDGLADIATISSEPINNSKGTISLFLATGDGNFSLPQTFPATNKPFFLTASDTDTDGLTDLAVVEDGLVEIFSGFLLNTGLITPRDRLGDPKNSPSGNGLSISAGTPISTAFARLNSDSISDLVVVSASATESVGKCEIFLSDNSNLTSNPNVMLKILGNVEVGTGSQKTLAIAAVNLPDPQTAIVDKDLDIFIATSLGIEIFENTTTNFVAQPILTLSSKVSQVMAGDLNIDSKTDILALDKTSGVVFDILAFNNGYAEPITVQSRANAITFALFNSSANSLSMAVLTSSSSQSSQNSIVVLSANRFGIFQFSNILPSDPTISINNPSVFAIGRPGRAPSTPANPAIGGDDILIGQHAIGANKGGLLL
ncbi:MAG: hypothetical protein FD167_5699, partial [bacterium]